MPQIPATRSRQSPGTSSTGFQDPVGDRAEQLLFVGEMPVQRAGGDVELAGQPPHRQVGDPVAVEQRRRRVDHVAFVELHARTLT